MGPVYLVWFGATFALIGSRAFAGLWLQAVASTFLVLVTFVLFRGSLRRTGRQGVSTGGVLFGRGKSRVLEANRPSCPEKLPEEYLVDESDVPVSQKAKTFRRRRVF